MFLLVLIISLITSWHIICSTQNKTLRIPNNYNIAFLGSSHIEYAINDTIIKNSFNFGRSAERAEFIYCKLKLLKRYNPQLDTVIIGFDNYLLTNPSDTSSYSKLLSPYFYNTYTITDLGKIFNSGWGCIESHISQPYNWLKLFDIIKSHFKTDFNASNMDGLGGYSYLTRDKLDEDIKRRKLSKNNQKSKYDNLSIYFLSETIKYCNKMNITVILLHTPIHNKLISEDNIYWNFYSENYSHLKFYDFRTLNLPDSCFGDLDHLNYKGAKVFSDFLEKEVLHKNNYPQ